MVVPKLLFIELTPINVLQELLRIFDEIELLQLC